MRQAFKPSPNLDDLGEFRCVLDDNKQAELPLAYFLLFASPDHSWLSKLPRGSSSLATGEVRGTARKSLWSSNESASN